LTGNRLYRKPTTHNPQPTTDNRQRVRDMKVGV
jgi:hypothetical protein